MSGMLGPTKTVLCGPTNSGKSTLLQKLLTGDFNTKHLPTLGVNVFSFRNTNVWDCAGDKKYQGLFDGYWIGGQKVVLMYDLNNPNFTELDHYMSTIKSLGFTDVHVVGNKKELVDSNALNLHQSYWTKSNVPFMSISTKNDSEAVLGSIF